MAKPMSKGEQRALSGITGVMGPLHALLYRSTKGRIGGRFVNGAPVMLLTTKGRKSGKLRTSPLLYLRDGERVLVVASKGGFPTHPAWYLNLQSQPEVEVNISGDVRTMHARTASPDERAGYWGRLCEMYPPYRDYQERTDRAIPVVILEPVQERN